MCGTDRVLRARGIAKSWKSGEETVTKISVVAGGTSTPGPKNILLIRAEQQGTLV